MVEGSSGIVQSHVSPSFFTTIMLSGAARKASVCCYLFRRGRGEGASLGNLLAKGYRKVLVRLD